MQQLTNDLRDRSHVLERKLLEPSATIGALRRAFDAGVSYQKGKSESSLKTDFYAFNEWLNSIGR
jgi:hypothetical protein